MQPVSIKSLSVASPVSDLKVTLFTDMTEKGVINHFSNFLIIVPGFTSILILRVNELLRELLLDFDFFSFFSDFDDLIDDVDSWRNEEVSIDVALVAVTVISSGVLICVAFDYLWFDNYAAYLLI